jgi:hypothetical protein
VLEVAQYLEDKISDLLFVSFVTAMIFFQVFTLPQYHSEQFGLTEFQTGLLMTWTFNLCTRNAICRLF